MGHTCRPFGTLRVHDSTIHGLTPVATACRRVAANGYFTHILIQWSEINRYRIPNNYGFSDWPQPKDIQQLVDDHVGSRVDWGFPSTLAELLEVK